MSWPPSLIWLLRPTHHPPHNCYVPTTLPHTTITFHPTVMSQSPSPIWLLRPTNDCYVHPQLLCNTHPSSYDYYVPPIHYVPTTLPHMTVMSTYSNSHNCYVTPTLTHMTYVTLTLFHKTIKSHPSSLARLLSAIHPPSYDYYIGVLLCKD